LPKSNLTNPHLTKPGKIKCRFPERAEGEDSERGLILPKILRNIASSANREEIITFKAEKDASGKESSLS